MIAPEAWRLEAQIINKMLERIGVKVRLEVFKHPELFRRIFIPYLEKPPDEQDWDILILHRNDWYGHTGASFLTVGLIEECNLRWIQSDLAYEKMWEDMAGTVDKKKQQEKIRRMVKYIYDRAWGIYIYSPMMLYALNKDVDFVPQKLQLLRLKETSVTDNHWSVRVQNESSQAE